jgi:hypothetical protein
LAAGDEVAVRFGGFAPIKTMVSHTLNCVSGKWVGEAKSNLPVLIRRGALGENSPNADLHLTGEHAVYVDGYLIKVGDLVNGTSITFEAADGRDTLDFFNIELDHHDILDVQGAFCESLYRAGTERAVRCLASPVAAAGFGPTCAAWHRLWSIDDSQLTSFATTWRSAGSTLRGRPNFSLAIERGRTIEALQ